MLKSIIAISLGLFALGCASAPAPSRDAVDRVIMNAAPSFSGVVGVSNGSALIHLKAYGVLDRETGLAHTPQEVWRWASVTKMATVILVLQEVDAGRLDLDGPLARYLPGFSVNADRITIRQLIQHTSGLANPDTGPDEGPGAPDGMPDFYQRMADWRPVCLGAPAAEPDTVFSYNNCDYLVLGAVLEKVSGQTYADLIQTRFVTPLGLSGLHLPGPGLRVEAYTAAGREPPTEPASWGASGGLYGTAEDMLKLDQALMAGRLISNRSRDAMWDGNPKAGYAALGVWAYRPDLKACLGETRLVERYGEIGGVQVRNFLLPDRNIAVVVYSNDGATKFGDVWSGSGLALDLLRAAACD